MAADLHFRCFFAGNYREALMIQDILAEGELVETFTPEDYRGLTPLMWAHVAMHGEFKLNMNSRLMLGPAPPSMFM
jgi:hypothetical protein